MKRATHQIHVCRRSATLLLVVCALTAATLPSLGADKTTLWVIEDDDNTVYLAGSVHVLRESDYPLAQGAFLLVTAVLVVMNFIADMLYAVLDPRVSHGSRR